MEIKDIYKSFDGKKVLNGFCAEFKQGESYCIMGKSGCGKTTLLNIITGIIKADSGEVITEPNTKLSVVFQEDRLCERLSAVANVRIVCNKNCSVNSIVSSLEAVGLTKADIKKPVSELSGGMRRRTAIVRAVMADSSVIILDEPFKGLDTETKEKTIRYILDSTKGRTLIIITHDEEDTVFLNGNIIYMNSSE